MVHHFVVKRTAFFSFLQYNSDRTSPSSDIMELREDSRSLQTAIFTVFDSVEATPLYGAG